MEIIIRAENPTKSFIFVVLPGKNKVDRPHDPVAVFDTDPNFCPSLNLRFVASPTSS